MANLICAYLRKRMMRAIARGKSVRPAARQFEVAASTAPRLAHHAEAGGTVDPRPPGPRAGLCQAGALPGLADRDGAGPARYHDGATGCDLAGRTRAESSSAGYLPRAARAPASHINSAGIATVSGPAIALRLGKYPVMVRGLASLRSKAAIPYWT